MLDVDRRDDVDAGVEQLLDVLPPLLVPGVGVGVVRRHVGVGELVDEHDLRPAGEDTGDVELREPAAPVLDLAAGEHLEALEHDGGVRPSVRLDVADDDVGAAREPAVGLVEHGDGLADAGRRSEVDPQRAPSHGPILSGHPALGAARRARARLSPSTSTRG